MSWKIVKRCQRNDREFREMGLDCVHCRRQCDMVIVLFSNGAGWHGMGISVEQRSSQRH